jgi:hypothetical protein
VVASSLSLEHRSAVPRRASDRLVSPRSISPPPPWIERPTTTRDEHVPSSRTRPHTIWAIRAPRLPVAVLPGVMNVDSEGIGEDAEHDAVLCYWSQRAQQARHDRAGDFVVSSRPAERHPNGVPMGGFGG